MPIRGRPTSPRSSNTQKLTESRISGLSGRSANMYSRAASMPPVRSIAMPASPSLMSKPPLRALDVLSEQRANRVEVQPEFFRLSLRVRFAPLRVRGPPVAHPYLELVGDRFAEPLVEAAHLIDRIGLHRTKVNVEEPAFGAAVTELHHS